MANVPELSPTTRDAVLDRFGLARPVERDADGLAELYRRWCRHVPFDNVRKLIALRGGAQGPLPGTDPEDFLTHWLDHGVGGTCWPGTLALTALCQACGFDARVVAASMADTGVASHGTTVVALDGAEWLVDSSMLTDRPLALAGHDTAIDDPVFATTCTPVPEGWLFGFPLPYATDPMPCRTISPGAVSQEFCLERYEISREMSPFNDRVSTRRNDDDGVVSYGGDQRFRRTAAGVEQSDLAGADLSAALVDEFGMSEEIVARLDAAG